MKMFKSSYNTVNMKLCGKYEFVIMKNNSECIMIMDVYDKVRFIYEKYAMPKKYMNIVCDFINSDEVYAMIRYYYGNAVLSISAIPMATGS